MGKKKPQLSNLAIVCWQYNPGHRYKPTQTRGGDLISVSLTPEWPDVTPNDLLMTWIPIAVLAVLSLSLAECVPHRYVILCHKQFQHW